MRIVYMHFKLDTVSNDCSRRIFYFNNSNLVFFDVSALHELGTPTTCCRASARSTPIKKLLHVFKETVFDRSRCALDGHRHFIQFAGWPASAD